MAGSAISVSPVRGDLAPLAGHHGDVLGNAFVIVNTALFIRPRRARVLFSGLLQGLRGWASAAGPEGHAEGGGQPPFTGFRG